MTSAARRFLNRGIRYKRRQMMNAREGYSVAGAKGDADADYCMIFGTDGEKVPQFPHFKSPKLDQLFGDALQPTPIKRLLDLTSRGRPFPSQYEATPPFPVKRLRGSRQ